LTAKNNSS